MMDYCIEEPLKITEKVRKEMRKSSLFGASKTSLQKVMKTF